MLRRVAHAARRRPFLALLALALATQAVLLACFPDSFVGVAPWLAALHEAPHVCIASADPLLLAGSRGTGEALWNLAVTLSEAAMRVHIVIIAPEHGLCVESAHQIFVSRLNVRRRITSSCAFIGDGSASHPLIVRARVAAHFESLTTACDVVVSHEWWGPIGGMLVASALERGVRAPVSIVNVHGGAVWSSSWQNASQRAFADWLLDADERVAARLCDYAVFPNAYMQGYHARRWALPGDAQVIPNIVLGLTAGSSGSTPAALAGREQPVSGLAYVGSVETRKGIDALMATLAALSDVDPIRLEVFGTLGVVGGEPAAAFITRMLADAPHVSCTVHGPVHADTLWPYLKEHRLLLVMPSVLENQPMTVILAHQHGVPLVSYDVGGVGGMLTTDSAALVLIPPTLEALRARVGIALRAGVAFVPELHPMMFDAKTRWVALLRTAVKASKARRREPRRARAALPSADVYALLHLSGNSSTDGLGDQLASSAAPLVLLMQPGYALRPELRDAFLAATEQLQLSDAVGFVSYVAMPDGTLLYPQPPYYVPASAWFNCGPEAPLLVKRVWLSAYLAAHAGMPFRPWLFTLWLFHDARARQLVLRAPHAFFAHHGCVDPLQCFWSEELVEHPRDILAEPRRFAARALPPARIAARAHDFDSDYARLVLDACAIRNTSVLDGVWARAAVTPRLCEGSQEHGLFTLRALRQSLLHSCGAHCVFLMGALPEPPVSALGWSLDAKQGCWREVGSHSHCSEWFHKRARMLPGAMDCVAPASAAAAPPAATPTQPPPCDLLLSKEEHPPAGKCAPRVLLAGFEGCGVQEVADLLAAHPQVNASLASPGRALLTARRAFYDALRTVPTAPLAARERFAAQFAATDGVRSIAFDDTLAYMPASNRMPARVARVMPGARVVLVACDPARRFWGAYNEAHAGDDARSSDAPRLLQKAGVGSYEALVALTLSDSAPGASVATRDATARLQRLFLERGFYALHLADWQRELGADRVLVLSAESLRAQPAATLARLFAFAGLQPAEGVAATARFAPSPWEAPPPGSQLKLAAVYQQYNAWLAGVLGDPFPLQWHA